MAGRERKKWEKEEERAEEEKKRRKEEEGEEEEEDHSCCLILVCYIRQQLHHPLFFASPLPPQLALVFIDSGLSRYLPGHGTPPPFPHCRRTPFRPAGSTH